MSFREGDWVVVSCIDGNTHDLCDVAVTQIASIKNDSRLFVDDAYYKPFLFNVLSNTWSNQDRFLLRLAKQEEIDFAKEKLKPGSTVVVSCLELELFCTTTITEMNGNDIKIDNFPGKFSLVELGVWARYFCDAFVTAFIPEETDTTYPSLTEEKFCTLLTLEEAFKRMKS